MAGTSNVRWSFSKAVPPAFAGAQRVDEEAAGNAAGLVRKVLVVDDEADLADLAAALPGSRGLDVVAANSALEALQVLGQDADIDAVFSDLMIRERRYLFTTKPYKLDTIMTLLRS